MSALSKIYQMAKNSLIDYKLQLKEDVLSPIKKEIDRICVIAQKRDKREIASTGNYEIFRIYMMLANYNLAIYDEMESILESYKSIINGWTYNKEGKVIRTLLAETAKSDDIHRHPRILEIMAALNLSTDMLEFTLKMPFHAILKFLRFKYEMDQLYFKTGINLPNSGKIQVGQKLYVGTGMENLIGAAIACIKDEIKDDKCTKENLKMRIKYTNEVLAALENEEEFLGMLSVPDEWHQYLDTKILEELYNIVHGNMLKNYLGIENKLKELDNGIEDNELKKYLISKKLDYDSLDEETKEKLKNVKDLIRKIQVLESMGIDINVILTKYIDCLLNFDEEKIKFIQNLIKVNALKKETITNYLFLILGEYFEKIKTNYTILKDIIDFNNVFYKDSLLFLDSHKLRNILSVLKEYNLSKNNYMFLLCNFQYIEIYDLMLEQNIPLELLVSICHTTNPVDTIKRIMIYRSIGESYENENHRLRRDVTNNSKIDGNLDDYIENVVPFIVKNEIKGDRIDNVLSDDIVKDLDNQYRYGDVYIIKGTRVSRGKFLRHYQKNKNPKFLIDSLVAGSIMSNSEYYSLYSEINRKLILTK